MTVNKSPLQPVNGAVGTTDTAQIVKSVDASGGVIGTTISLIPRTTGGASIYHLKAANTTNSQSVKGTPGQLYGYYLFNASASTKYVKLYNKATAPTVGTDVPVLVYPLPAGAAANVAFPNGVSFSLGIGIGITGALADNDTTAVAANDVIVNLNYI